MRAEPTPQQGPEPFHGIHMDFTKAVAIFIAGALAPAMVDTPMVVSPAIQASINAILVCIHTCTWNDGVFDKGFDGLLLDISQQIDHHLPTALHHPKDRWPFLLQGASTTFPLESASSGFVANFAQEVMKRQWPWSVVGLRGQGIELFSRS